MITFERFEAAKIKRFIQMYGNTYTFRRPDLNAYKQPTGKSFDQCIIKGVYHEASYKYLAEKVSAAGSVVNDLVPMILCMKDENSDSIKPDDEVVVNGKHMVVEKVKDLNNCGFAYDISLRYIDYGCQA